MTDDLTTYISNAWEKTDKYVFASTEDWAVYVASNMMILLQENDDTLSVHALKERVAILASGMPADVLIPATLRIVQAKALGDALVNAGVDMNALVDELDKHSLSENPEEVIKKFTDNLG